MFPLGTALLPGEPLPLRIFEPRYRAMLDDCLTSPGGPPRFGVVLIARGSEVGGGDVRHDVGTFAVIESVNRDPDGRATLTCTGTERFRVVQWLPDDPYPRARVSTLPETAFTSADRARAGELGERIRGLIARVADGRDLDAGELLAVFDADALTDEDAFTELYRWAAHLPIGTLDRQHLLESRSPDDLVAALREAIDGFAARVEFGL